MLAPLSLASWTKLKLILQHVCSDLYRSHEYAAASIAGALVFGLTCHDGHEAGNSAASIIRPAVGTSLAMPSMIGYAT